MRRREFITLLGGAAAWPVVADGQQFVRPLIGFLGAPAREAYVHYAAALRRGLTEAGYVEGQNLTIEERWAENQYDRRKLPLQQFLLSSIWGPIQSNSVSSPALIAQVATSRAPPCSALHSMPRLELLHEAAPIANSIGLLVNPTNPQTEELSRQVLEAAHTMGLSIAVVGASSAAEIEPCFAELVKKQAGRLVISADSFLGQRAQQIAGLALRYKIPTITQGRQFAEAGGLMSYSTDIVDVYRQVGIYVGRVLKGENLTFQLRNRPNSSLPSISEPQRRWPLMCRPCSSPAPTK
jgi:putative ABC transport system substrate-binding protein